MPRYEITAPDGTRWEVNAPDGASQQEVLAYAQKQWAAPSAGPTQTQTQNRDLSSQAGLALRAGLKGALALPAMGADAIGGALNAAQDLALGQGRGFRFQQTLPSLDALLTRAGVPEPDTATQRMVSKAVELGTGAGAAAGLAGLGSKATTGVAREVLSRLSAAPQTQIGAGVGSGLAGQHSAENGGDASSQFVSSVLGGLAGAGAVGGIRSVGSALQNRMAPAVPAAEVERRVTVALQRQGVDLASMPQAIRRTILADAQAAMKQGQLDEQALSRLADYRMLGLTPTRGRLTLDPLDVTREQNAMRMAAATGAGDARLPAIAQGNNQRLLGAIENLQPLADRTGAGEQAMRPILARDAAMQGRERALYDAARAMPGGNEPLAQGQVMQGIWRALDDDLKTPFVPESIARVLNEISTGARPFDVRTIDVLKTTLATASRGAADGNVRRALSIIRDQLDQVPLQQSGTPAFGGGQLVNGATAAAMRSGDSAPGDLMQALNAARRSAFERRQWQESAPGIARALDGASADTFLQTNVLSRSASVADVARLAESISSDAGAMQAVRGSIVQHLKDAAIGRGNAGETANLSGRQWLAALDGIGDRKLALFFSPQEVAQLRAIGRTGTIETFQPRGSAVNNSNTAAGMAGLLQGLGRYMKPVANKLPFGQEVLSGPLDRITLSVMERGANDVPRGLLTQVPQRQGGLLDPLLLPALTSGGLLAAP